MEKSAAIRFYLNKYFLHYLPNPIYKMIPKRYRDVDLRVISLIREKNMKYLSNPHLIETNLLPKLGISDEAADQIEYFPEELSKCNKQGLKIWQYPIQFSKYLIDLSKSNINSYLEIGVRHGGSFILTVEYLQKFHPIKKAIGVDINDCLPLREYKKINSKIDFLKIDSKSPEFKKFIELRGVWDLAFIDGDHSEEGCWNDFMVIKDKCRMIAVHDICSDYWPSVVKVWNKIKRDYSKEYTFYEYKDQYKSIKDKGKAFMGIGLAVKKSK